MLRQSKGRQRQQKLQKNCNTEKYTEKASLIEAFLYPRDDRVLGITL
jgi:hypothetical protein